MKGKGTGDPCSQPSDGHVKTNGPGSDRDQAIDTGTANCAKGLLVPRLMASLFSLISLGIGVMAIQAAHYYARSGRLGGTDISLDGLPAIAMGVSTIFWGLIPLALWFRTKRTRIAWAIACIVVATAVFFVSVFLQHI